MPLNYNWRMHQKNILTAGKKLEESGRALIMIHGRGSTAKIFYPSAVI
jgi:hypothetical protein